MKHNGNGNRAKLRALRLWVAEFKRAFGVRFRVVCKIEDLSSTRDGHSGCLTADCMGTTEAHGKGATVKSVAIVLDPRCWDEKHRRRVPEGPYGCALHEFLHAVLTVLASRRWDFDTEEVAVRLLTRQYQQPVANGEAIKVDLR
jgi:hypothetical protein